MRTLLKVLLLTFVTVLCGLQVEAQTTTVTLNVTDAGGVIWANGTYTAVLLQPAGNPVAPFYLNGVLMTSSQTNPPTAALGITGSATFNLSSNTSITPVNTHWGITACLNAATPCFYGTFTVTGGTQTINMTPPASQSSGVNKGIIWTCKIGSSTVVSPAAGFNFTQNCPAIPPGFLLPGDDIMWKWFGEVTPDATHAGMVSMAFFLDATQILAENASCLTGQSAAAPVFESRFEGDVMIGGSTNPPTGGATASIATASCQFPAAGVQQTPFLGDNNPTISTTVAHVPSIQVIAQAPIGFTVGTDIAWIWIVR